jgi:hypothetical protein
VGTATSGDAALTVDPVTLLLTADPSSLHFAEIKIGSSSTIATTLTNSGNSSVTLGGVNLSGPGFSVSDAPSGVILSPRQAATMNVTFAPASSGSVTGSITVTSNASNSPATIVLSGSGISPSTFLTWTASISPVEGYHVYSGKISDGPYTKLTTSPIPATSYVDSTVESGNTYYYVVTAVDSEGIESEYSNMATAVIP